MPLDPAIRDANRAATDRIRGLVARLNDTELQHPVGQHWTVAITLAHIAFWDRRVLDLLERSERAGALAEVEIDVLVNDLSLPFWAAIPPGAASRLAIETATALDDRLDAVPQELLDAVAGRNQRWVRRSLHRTEHLDEAEAALAG